MTDRDLHLRERLGALPSRSEKSRAAAAWLFFEKGEHPSVQRVRELTGIGSASDIARDLREFWQDVRSRLKSRIASPDLPQSVVDHVGDFVAEIWDLALDRAHATLAAERAALQSELTQARSAVLQAQADAQAQKDLVGHLQTRVDTAMAQQESEAAVHGALTAELEAVKAALADATDRHAAELLQREATTTALRADMREQAQAQQRQAEVFEGELRFAKLQIENARGEGRHWKAEFERERAESTMRLSTLEQRLAGEREQSGRLLLRAEEAERAAEQLRGQLAALRPLRKARGKDRRTEA